MSKTAAHTVSYYQHGRVLRTPNTTINLEVLYLRPSQASAGAGRGPESRLCCLSHSLWSRKEQPLNIQYWGFLQIYQYF